MSVIGNLLKRTVIFSISVIVILSAASSQAQTGTEYVQWENGVGRPWILPTATKEEIDALTSRWKAVEEELKSTSDEFAGTYIAAGSMRQNILRWAPEGGFIYLYVYENYSVIDFSYGRVRVTPSEIVFIIEREQKSKDFKDKPRITARHWVPAKWKKGRYMIPADSIREFGNYVAGFGAYNDFNGPCCEFDPFLGAEAKGGSEGELKRPRVPRVYERFLKEPIRAEITHVGKKRVVRDYKSSGDLYYNLHQIASLTAVRINAGRNHGVKPGLLFRLVGQPGYQYLKITRVRHESSEGVIVRDVDEKDGRETYYDSDSGELAKKTYPPVPVGTKVTTSPLVSISHL